MESNEKSVANNYCVGIDLGTTNSVLAIINNKLNGDAVSKVLELPRPVEMYSTSTGFKASNQRKPTLPSCVYYQEDRNFEPLVGDFAKSQYALRPHLVAKSIKSQMGKEYAEGLTSDIPDKTPAQISAQILKHMLKQASKVCRCEIDDAVITVPANFDSVMCQATREAAKLAGIKITNEDGTEKDILLSEPKAVIYDLINQIHNGDVPSHILELNEPKKVIVFDLGGGTLDITLHDIRRHEESKDILKINEIATNRYTLLGGDDFDNLIAEKMFERYLKQYEKHPDAVKRLREEKKTVFPKLQTYAESLKIEASEKHKGENEDDGWFDDEDEGFTVGGNMGTGYSYDDCFTTEEIESILMTFMAEELEFYDYKKLASIKNTRNIIYPILDVLQKAEEKLGENNLKVDAVIVNGGMSKFYMITDRLTKFFGFEPIVALDPDQSVARGAAVYHHYLHKYEAMLASEMADKKIEASDKAKTESMPEKYVRQEKPSVSDLQKNKIDIEIGSNILNDSLFLGAKNGAVTKIIPTGAELPYMSEVMTGFAVEPNQSYIRIPIKSKNIDGSYRTIACGKISLENRYKDGAYVAFTVFMSSNKVITINAWTCMDKEGTQKLESCAATITIGGRDELSMGNAKVSAPAGSLLKPVDEINYLIQICKNSRVCRKKLEKQNYSKKLHTAVSNIINAGNKDEFAPIIIGALEKNEDLHEAVIRLYKIARNQCEYWDKEYVANLADICLSNLASAFKGYGNFGTAVSTGNEAIYTLAACGNNTQLEKLRKLHGNSKYRNSCLYVHGKTKTCVDWIDQEFCNDANVVTYGIKTSGIQQSAYALGMVLRRNGVPSGLGSKRENELIKILIRIIESGNVDENCLPVCILALGWACDRRQDPDVVSSELKSSALEAINSIFYKYSYSAGEKANKSVVLAQKMICGEVLTRDEEQYLLTQLNK